MADPQFRDVRAPSVELAGHKGVYDQSWAVVIGINRYEHQRSLTYAVPDAVGIAETLISRLDFPARNVFLVLDPPEALSGEQAAWLAMTKPALGGFEPRASKAVIEQLLTTTLPERTGDDDRVLVYFAGHGTPRRAPGGSARPYLIPADGVTSRWETYIDLETLVAQGEYVAAKHMLYLFDACSAGLVGVPLRAAEDTSRYERELLHHKARQCITAGTAEGAAADIGFGGHSPFTWHILQVLRGEVRLAEDDMVSTTTLTAYIKETVGKQPGSRQIPDSFPLKGHAGGEFVFSASRAPLTLDERAVLARLLVDGVGLRIDEPAPIELAATLWRVIAETAPGESAQAVEAHRELARADLLLGRADEARPRLAAPALANDIEAAFLRGLASLRLKDRERAQAELSQFAAEHPEHRYAAWARRAAASAHHRRHALLVGVGTLKNRRGHLQGVVNDVAAMADLLTTTFEFDVVEKLQDQDATVDGIKAAFDRMAASIGREDSFLFYFSGHGGQKDGKTFFITYDTGEGGLWLSEDELKAALRAIPAQDKVVVTDGCYMAPPDSEHPLDYRHFAASRRDQAAYELLSPDGVYRGAFTLAFEQEMRELGNRRVRDVWPRIQQAVMRRFIMQHPVYVGAWGPGLVNDDNVALQIFDLGERGVRGPLSLRRVDRFLQWLRDSAPSAGLEPQWLGIGRALLAKRSYAASIDVLASIDQRDAGIPLLRARLLCDRYGEALDGWQRHDAKHAVVALDDLGQRSASELTALLGELRQAQRHALLVMVGAWTSEGWTSEPGATLESIRDALVQRCGFSADHIAMLSDPDKEALLQAFDAVAATAGAQPIFFLFVGPGFDGDQTWISGSSSWNMPLEEIGARLPQSENLTSAIFITEDRPSDDALIAAATRTPGVHRGVPPPLGRTTVVAVPLQSRDVPQPIPPERRWLIDVLTDYAHAGFSASEWRDHVQGPAAFSVRGDDTASLFSYASGQRRALELLCVVEHAPLRRALPLLIRLAVERDLVIHACLLRAIVHGELGYYAEARLDLEAAEERHHQYHAPRGNREQVAVPAWPELHYQRGRILFEAAAFGRAEYTEAIAELTVAIRYDANHARAHYYRAQAIRRLIEGDLERQIRESELRYHELGAPLGTDDER